MAIHKLIYRANGNSHLEDVLVRYDNVATRIWCLAIDKLPDLAKHVREHSTLLEAIAVGDGTASSLALDHASPRSRQRCIPGGSMPSWVSPLPTGPSAVVAAS